MGLWLVLVISPELQCLLELLARTQMLGPIGSGLPCDVAVKVIGSPSLRSHPASLCHVLFITKVTTACPVSRGVEIESS